MHRPNRGIKIHRKKKFEPVLETESGIRVRSNYERKCADYLSRNNIKFEYEPLMILGGRKYRPDFFLPEYNLFLEICGYGHMPFYRHRSQFKKQVYVKYGLQSVFIHYNGRGSLEQILKQELGKFKVAIPTT